MTTETAKLYQNGAELTPEYIIEQITIDANNNITWNPELYLRMIKRLTDTPKPQGEVEEPSKWKSVQYYMNEVQKLEISIGGLRNELQSLKLSHGKLVEALKEILYSDECNHIDVAESIAREALSSITQEDKTEGI